MSKILLATNEYQTDIDEDLKESLPDEVYMELVEFCSSVEFVKQLISPERKRAIEMKRDKKGRIEVDVTKPHILEDMDFFIQDRLHYEKHGYYSATKKSKDPRSPYRKHWDEQKKRGLQGMINPTTGEWISGYNYWYWNYGRIQATEAEEGEEVNEYGKVRADRDEFFPDLWEIDYFYFHYLEQAEQRGLFAALLKCRGMGASFKSANMTLRNYFLIRRSSSFVMATSDSYFYEDGIMEKVTEQEAFIQNNTAYRKNKLNSSMGHIKSGVKDKHTDVKTGFLSEVAAVNTLNPQKSRGKRAKLVIQEEAGSNKTLIKSWGIVEKSLDDKGNVFGIQIAMGTGGDEHSDFLGLTNLFFRPKGYSVYDIPNVFDKNATNTRCGFFMGEYMNRPRSYNDNGTTDVVMNLVSIFKQRHILQTELQDAEAFAQKKAEGAITPLESIISMQHSMFPRELLKMCISELSNDYMTVTKHHHHGNFARSNGKASFIHGGKPILDYPYLGKQQHMAAAVIKTMPETHGDGSIPWGRYIMGVDTLEDDGGGGSLFSWQIMDLWKDDIVAWYIGRKTITADDYDQVLAACMMYNASCNYENNLKGLYGFFNNHNALRYLADTPQILKDKGFAAKKQNIGNKDKGTRANQNTNKWGRELQAGWLRKSHMYYEGKRGAETVEDLEYLRECSMWEPMGNYDKVSCGNMLFIYREELTKATEYNRFSEDRPTSEYEGDSFFDEFGASSVPLAANQEENELNF